MKFIRVIFTTVLLTTVCTALSKEVDQITLKSWMDDAGIPGLSMVEINEGKITQRFAVGLRDNENSLPVTHDTVFEAASLSKPVLAYIVARLVDSGELSLDTPLVKFIDYERFDNDAFAKMLTPRLVLSHQSGLPNWGGTPLTFNFKPGVRFGYSGEGFVYLQRALEKKTGMSLQALAEKEVFGPLGMKNSAFSFSEDHPFELSRAHSQLDVASDRNFPSDNAASSLHTTASDYAKFIRAFFHSEYLSNKTREAMMQTQVRMPESWSNDPDVALAKNLAWSLGWAVVTDAEKPVYWHWGDNGDFKAFVAYQPTTQNGVVYFANSSNGLAITQSLYTVTLADVLPAIDWLGYVQFDAQGYRESREGFLAERKAEYANALALYQASLAKYPDNNMMKEKVEWLSKYIDKIENPTPFSEQMAAPFIGKYGPRHIRLEGTQLIYQRQGNQAHTLVQIAHNEFIIPSVMNFKVEFVLGKNNLAEKIVGHYGSDHSDETLRTE